MVTNPVIRLFKAIIVVVFGLALYSSAGAFDYSEFLIKAVAGGKVEVLNPDSPAQHAVAVSVVGSVGSSLCSGALVSKDMVVTAAHCFETLEPSSEVFIGFFNGEEQVAVAEARQVAVHKDFKMGAEKFRSFADLDVEGSDVAILRFDDDLPAGFKPVRVLKDLSKVFVGQKVVAMGIGRTEVKDSNFAMRSVDLEIGFHNPNYVNVSMVYDPTKKKAVCVGDSGGPVFVKLGSEYFLWGLNQSVFKSGCQPPYESFAVNLAHIWNELPQKLKTIEEYQPSR